eukprot:GILI01050711.1.p1 GENE.GILI01050711.1~~GILI01050711.1.p1  ORF type:complete len:155 (-),score=26.20 GILI01050711.1:191-586(-)
MKSNVRSEKKARAAYKSTPEPAFVPEKPAKSAAKSTIKRGMSIFFPGKSSPNKQKSSNIHSPHSHQARPDLYVEDRKSKDGDSVVSKSSGSSKSSRHSEVKKDKDRHSRADSNGSSSKAKSSSREHKKSKR